MRATFSRFTLSKTQSLALISLAVSLIFTGYAAIRFWQLKPLQAPTSTHWNLYLFGLLTWILAAFLLTSPAANTIPQPSLRLNIPLILIIGLAIFLRVYDLHRFPYGVWHDEAGAGLQGQYMLADPDYRPIFIGSMNITFPHMYLYAIMLKFFGATNIQAMRLISVAFGVGASIMGYFVGRQLRGHYFGLLMATFLAVMRWSIHFSHIAMTGIDTIFFILLTLYFLLRVSRSHSLRDALWAGLAIGSGLWFYSAYRLSLLAMLLAFILTWRGWRPFSKPLKIAAVMGFTALLTILPLAIFAYHNTDYFIERVNSVSIEQAQNRFPATSVNQALRYNIEAYLKMFNFSGDPRPMHNLPNEPMLDPIMGILLIIGLLTSIHRRDTWVFFLLLIAAIASGIMTNQYSSPSAGRSIGAIPSLAFFSALALWQIAQILQRFHVPLRFIQASGLTIVGAIIMLNGLKYHQQSHDYRVWADFATNDKSVSERIAQRHQQGHSLIASRDTFAYDTTHFLLPDIFDEIQSREMSTLFPLRFNLHQPLSIILARGEEEVLAHIQGIYSTAQIETITLNTAGLNNAPPQKPTIGYIIDINPADQKSIQGLSANGQGFLYISEIANYEFELAEHQYLIIDGISLTPENPTIELVEGFHFIETNATPIWRPYDQLHFSAVPLSILYQREVFHGLWGYFYPNENWEGEPSVRRFDPSLSQYFHILPLSRPYTALWDGFIEIPKSGTYHFQLRVVGYAKLSLDNQVIVESNRFDEYATAQIALAAGVYPIQLHFHDTRAYSEIVLEWRFEDDPLFTPIPSTLLMPQTGLSAP